MKKIFFKDKYCLTQAALEGRKTMKRQLVPDSILNMVDEYQREYYEAALEQISERDAILNMITGERMLRTAYQVGEVVAVAQPYKDIVNNKFFINQCLANEQFPETMLYESGWNNKIKTASYYMPHRIRITNIKVERLQDISDKDCMREGITMMTEGKIEIGNGYGWDTKIDALKRESFFTPKAAFAALINKVIGKGTWERNPWVLVYEFELIRKEE